MSRSHLSALHLPHETLEDVWRSVCAPPGGLSIHPPCLSSTHRRSEQTDSTGSPSPTPLPRTPFPPEVSVTWASALPRPSALAPPMPHGWCVPQLSSVSAGAVFVGRTCLADLFSDRLASQCDKVGGQLARVPQLSSVLAGAVFVVAHVSPTSSRIGSQALGSFSSPLGSSALLPLGAPSSGQKGYYTLEHPTRLSLVAALGRFDWQPLLLTSPRASTWLANSRPKDSLQQTQPPPLQSSHPLGSCFVPRCLFDGGAHGHVSDMSSAGPSLAGNSRHAHVRGV